MLAGLGPPNPQQSGGLLSLGKPGLLDDLFAQAGFRDIETRKLSAPFRTKSAREYVDFIKASAGPIRDLLMQLDPAARDAGWTTMEEKLKVFESAGGFAAPNELLLTCGRR
jgi:hypothetical protein